MCTGPGAEERAEDKDGRGGVTLRLRGGRSAPGGTKEAAFVRGEGRERGRGAEAAGAEGSFRIIGRPRLSGRGDRLFSSRAPFKSS